MADLTVLVNSTDSYRDCWEPFFTLFTRYWPDCPYPVALIADHADFEWPGLDLRPIRTGILRGRSDLTWSECLATALGTIRTEHVLYLQEDYFLTGPVDTARIESLLRRQQALAIDCIQFFPASAQGRSVEGHEDLVELPRHTPYRINLQAGIWRTRALTSVLRRHESPWQLEVWGSRRPGTRRLRVFGLRADGADRADPIPYGLTGVVRGRWNRSVVVDLFAREGIEIDYSVRGFLDSDPPDRTRAPLASRALRRLRSLV